MLNKFNKSVDFSGHNVYSGLDVHGKSWVTTIIVDDIEHRRFTQPPEPLALYNYLSSHFPGANYFSAYEAGFCGYHHHRKLLELGIQNIVINAADLPVTNKEKMNKNDHVDSRRLAQALQKNELKAIFVFGPEHEQFRSLFRMRCRAAKEHRRVKNRIRSFMYYYGINPPSEFKPDYWPVGFIHWLNGLNMPTQAGTLSLKYLLKAYQTTREQLLEVTRQLRREVTIHYPDLYKLLMTVPGIGPIVSMCLIAEIGDITRFKSYRHLSSYVGFIPNSHQSGDKDPTGRLTYRSNKYLRSMLVEAAWVAMRHDPALLRYYRERITKQKSQIVIIKIAHKLLNRVRQVWISNKPYQTGIA
jgi:transposase